MSEVVEVRGNEGDLIAITVLNREWQDCDDEWDGNWLNSKVELRLGGFRGKFSASLRSEELKSFLVALEVLSAELQGVAEFKTMEQQLSLKLEIDSCGRLAVSGRAEDRAGIGNRLTFEFESDQSYLPGVIESLRAVIDRFPVRGGHAA